jgi:predicted tellurium resistance membrane protein TerC
MDFLWQADTWIGLVTLTAMEVVLGIDNVVFLAILVGRLPQERRASARRTGLLLAMGMRLALLFAISWVMGLSRPLFHLFGRGFSGRDLILLAGGLFLIGKATREIHHKLETPGGGVPSAAGTATYGAVLVQVALLDLVFSLDSVITAVGMARHVAVMIAAMVIAVGVMMVYAGRISDFVERHPTMKMLALSFLILIGVLLTADGLGQHVNKGYIYFAMAFSLAVEVLNMRVRRAPPSPPQRA